MYNRQQFINQTAADKSNTSLFHAILFDLGQDLLILPKAGANGIKPGFGAKHQIPNKHSKVFAPSDWKWFLLQR